MAIKTRYCPHENRTHKYLKSKSSRVMCCDECYIGFIGEEIISTFGVEFLNRLDAIKQLPMERATGGGS